MTKIAVVADVHLHDLYGGYGMVEEGSGELALRTLADTTASTRVFNESYPAFLAVLDDIVRRGIRDVVLLGDYSDDGQPGAVTALKAILSSYEEQHGLRFFATFGNHDCFGPVPHKQAKRLTKADGSAPLLVASEDYQKPADMVRSGMLGMKTLDAMQAMAPYGIARPYDVLHWETPFGNPDALSNRRPDASNIACLDASYLIEPQQGLWLLMLDANVFQNTGDTWTLKADAAWDHVLAQRPYLLTWIEDVACRAKELGKTLLAFSHYPALPLALQGEGDAVKAACTAEWLKRMPMLETGRRLSKAGIAWHFSGHMHVSARVEHAGLANIAVPSPVAYPGGYVVVTGIVGSIDVETIKLADVAGFDVAFPAYRFQSGKCEKQSCDTIIAASNYAEFLFAHMRGLIEHRHLPADWSMDFHSQMDEPLGNLLRRESWPKGFMQRWQHMASMSLRQMVEDYYLFRAGGEFALVDLPVARIEFYRDIAAQFDSQLISTLSEDADIVAFLNLFVAVTAPYANLGEQTEPAVVE